MNKLYKDFKKLCFLKEEKKKVLLIDLISENSS